MLISLLNGYSKAKIKKTLPKLLVKKINPKYASHLERYSKNYLAFLNSPEEIRRYIYTTNVIESINAELEYIMKPTSLTQIGKFF